MLTLTAVTTLQLLLALMTVLFPGLPPCSFQPVCSQFAVHLKSDKVEQIKMAEVTLIDFGYFKVHVESFLAFSMADPSLES